MFSGWGEGIRARSLLVISCNNRGMKSRNKLPQGNVGTVREVSCGGAISGELAGHGGRWRLTSRVDGLTRGSVNFAGVNPDGFGNGFRKGLNSREIREVGGRWSG